MIYAVKEGESKDFLINVFGLENENYYFSDRFLFIERAYESYIISNEDTPIKVAEKFKTPIKEVLRMACGIFLCGKIIWIKK